MEWKNLDKCSSYEELKKLEKINLAELFESNNITDRIKELSVDMAVGLKFNYAGKAVNKEILDSLQSLADEQNLIAKYKALLNGEFINTGENRKILHHLTRGQVANKVDYNGVDMREFYLKEIKKIADFSEKVHKGFIKSSTGKAFSTVVQIGIGGSDLGPRAMYLALENYAEKNNLKKMQAHFISNVDPDDCQTVLNKLDLEKTLFILVSKSGTTQETLANQKFVNQVLKENNLDPRKHMLAVTSETSPLANNPDYLESFYMDDFIGGRYSSSSVCGGVVLSLAFGVDVFKEFLLGAHESDKLALEPNIRKNASLLDAMIGVYERNVLDYRATAILPYSQALSRFPAHLQQLDMESNGKSVNRFGEEIHYKTGPVIFGEPGTNGQHSFYQLLHQGSDIIPLQFIGLKNSQLKADVELDGSTNSEKLTANLLAQIIAFVAGKKDENKNKHFCGNRPASLIYGKELNPKRLGALLAHFENKVMFQGFVWNLNSFDQEGVQLGKLLAKKVLANNMPPALKALKEVYDEI